MISCRPRFQGYYSLQFRSGSPTSGVIAGMIIENAQRAIQKRGFRTESQPDIIAFNHADGIELFCHDKNNNLVSAALAEKLADQYQAEPQNILLYGAKNALSIKFHRKLKLDSPNIMQRLKLMFDSDQENLLRMSLQDRLGRIKHAVRTLNR